jgi:hypothetical protein
LSQHERFGGREGEAAYSAFHRSASLSRWLPYEDAVKLSMINLDLCFWIECHHQSFQPIALIETAQDFNQFGKPITALRNLAIRADLPAFCVLYELSEQIDPLTGLRQVVSFRTRHVWPKNTEFKRLSPEEYAQGLVKLRKFGLQNIVLAEARKGDGQKRNHDVARLVRKIEKLSPQIDMWL